MATVLPPTKTDWTLTQLAERFGDIPLSRIIRDPAPGTATIDDVVRLEAHEDRVCELIDGVLLEKTVGAWESLLAGQLITLLNKYLADNQLGLAFTADGMLQIFPGQVRIPDASFVSWKSLEGSGFPEEAAPLAVPDLAIEVLSPSNSEREMDRKLDEYFEAGVRLVWYVDPRAKTVTVHTKPDQPVVLTEAETLTGGEVLPGLEIDLRALFLAPKAPGK